MEAAAMLAGRARAAVRAVEAGEAEELERAWAARPWSVGIAAEDARARTELLDRVCGEKVLDPLDRPLGGAAMRVRRGARTRFRPIRVDGPGEAREPEQADAGELARLTGEVAAAREVHDARALALVRITDTLPRLLRGRPPWWLAPIAWVVAWFVRAPMRETRRARAEAAAASSGLEAAERALAALEETIAGARARYWRELRAAASTRGVVEIELELAGGILPEGIELLELAGTTRAAASVDAVLVVEQDAIYACNPDGERLRIGGAAEAIAALPALLPAARAVRIARRALDVLAAAAARAEAELARAEQDIRTRLARFDELRVVDPDGFAEELRGQLRPPIVASVQAILEHASVHLGRELAELATDWIDSIAAASSNDELRATVERLDGSAAASAQRIAGEVRQLLVQGAAGIVHDLHPALVAALRPHGLPEPATAPPAPPLVLEVLPALAAASAKLGGARSWLSGLFRSFEARRTDVREKAHAWLEQLRDGAQDELLDAEPRLHAAVGDAVAADLAALIARQAAWLAAAVAAEHEAVQRDRAALASLGELRDRALASREELARVLASVEAERPIVAAAAAAAA